VARLGGGGGTTGGEVAGWRGGWQLGGGGAARRRGRRHVRTSLREEARRVPVGMGGGGIPCGWVRERNFFVGRT
jgi:hypothetical protein